MASFMQWLFQHRVWGGIKSDLNNSLGVTPLMTVFLAILSWTSDSPACSPLTVSELELQPLCNRLLNLSWVPNFLSSYAIYFQCLVLNRISLSLSPVTLPCTFYHAEVSSSCCVVVFLIHPQSYIPFQPLSLSFFVMQNAQRISIYCPHFLTCCLLLRPLQFGTHFYQLYQNSFCCGSQWPPCCYIQGTFPRPHCNDISESSERFSGSHSHLPQALSSSDFSFSYFSGHSSSFCKLLSHFLPTMSPTQMASVTSPIHVTYIFK